MEIKQLVQASFCEIDITPNFSVSLIGGVPTVSTGILHRLKAQVLLLKEPDATYCLLTIDNLGFTTWLTDKLRQEVAAVLGTEPSRVMVCFSHTHAAPDPLSAHNGDKYYRLLCGKIQEALFIAQENLVDCKAAWSLGAVNIGENRRFDCDTVDTRLGALKIVQADTEEPLVLLLRATAHNNVMMGDNTLVSSDFFGVTRKKLQEELSHPVMMVQGACGNIKPAGVDAVQGGNVADLDRLANLMLEAVKKLSFSYETVNTIQMQSRQIQFSNIVPEKEQAEKIAVQAMETCGIDGAKWLEECQKLWEEGIQTQENTREIQFLQINQGIIAGISEEIFCEISLVVMEQTQNPYFFFNGYTNGCTAYLPTGQELEKGGYEVLYSLLLFFPFHGHVTPFEKGADQKLIQAAVEGVQKLTK